MNEVPCKIAIIVLCVECERMCFCLCTYKASAGLFFITLKGDKAKCQNRQNDRLVDVAFFFRLFALVYFSLTQKSNLAIVSVYIQHQIHRHNPHYLTKRNSNRIDLKHWPAPHYLPSSYTRKF